MAFDKTDKQALNEWEEFLESIRNSTPVDLNETQEQKVKRIKRLEAEPEEWFKYYFPKFAYAEPADFHKKASKRVLNNMEWYEVRNWSRELAKSTKTMMETLNLTLTGKKRYVMLISNTYDNAVRLLMPYQINLQANQRIINDYGVQENLGKWATGEFTTRKGVAFRALGAGQSPRGSRNEEARPDVLLFDDLDTDEDCRNPDIIDKRWRWIEDAAIGTRSISQGTTIIFCGNIIAKDCCVVRAQEFADYVDIVNIRDNQGKSSWPAKNTEEHIDRVLSQKSYLSVQREYYNNPIEEGTTFKEMTWGKCPPIEKCEFVVVYGDPSPSNKDKPARSSKVQNSCKAVVVVGYYQLKFYVYVCWLDVTTNSNFVDWLYASRSYVAKAALPYFLIENNGLQNPHFEQVLMPLIFEKGKSENSVLGITPDDRDKPEKFFRIEGTLEPKNRNGSLILNIAEKENPHMKRLEAQFKSVAPNSKTMDGPDATEGGVKKIENMVAMKAVSGVQNIKRPTNQKRY